MCSCTQKSLRATEVEPTVWTFVSDLLADPDKVRAGMKALIEQERASGPGDSVKQAELWTQKFAECSRLRKAYQDQQAAGLMTLEELRERLEELESTRRLAQTELEVWAERRARVKELEEDRDTLLERMAETVPSALDALTGEERNNLYRMLSLEVTPSNEGYEVSGTFCTSELTSG